MDRDTLQALIETWRAHPSTDILSIIVEKADSAEGRAAVASFLDTLPPDLWQGADRHGLRRRACALALDAGALALAERLAGLGSGAEDRLLQARVLLAGGQTDAARRVYAEAVAINPVLQDTELEKRLGQQAEGGGAKPLAANVISLTSYSARREARGEGEAREALAELGLFGDDEVDRVTFADIGGLEAVKAQIRRRIILPFLKPSLFERFRRKAGGGVLLYGPPGCGKTLLARAVAGECDARFIAVGIANVLDKYVGESEKRLNAVFEEARADTPAVVFFDELEALAARRRYGSHDVSASLVSAFLSELDGFQRSNDGVLILAATNVPWAIDAAFRRPGRFDRMHFVPPPDKDAREEILLLLLKDLPGCDTIDITRIVKRTAGFSGADLKHLVETAADAAIDQSLQRGQETGLSQAMFDDALKAVKPTTLEWLTTARNYAKYANVGGQYDEVLAFIEAFGR